MSEKAAGGLPFSQEVDWSRFAPLLVQWQRQHGRHHLPWQQTRDPYRVWLSEIMLQQTQVGTVLGYYERFLQAFPTVVALADASQDAVMGLWSGLGYYSRARNLHRCAQQVRDEHGGVFPPTRQALQTLPGIGPSTAAAIAAFCFGERVSIFDANVQRVVARLLACGQDLARAAHARTLAQYAQALLPAATPDGSAHSMTAYTQGLMDLGATVCTPRHPACATCPVATLCRAHAQGRAQDYPVKSNKIKRSAEDWYVLALIAHDDARPPSSAAIWLHKRPQSGIWAGLYCLPVFASENDLRAATEPISGQTIWVHAHAPIKHMLTHKDLTLHPIAVHMRPHDQPVFAHLEGAWHTNWRALGLPAPVRKWLQALLDKELA